MWATKPNIINIINFQILTFYLCALSAWTQHILPPFANMAIIAATGATLMKHPWRPVNYPQCLQPPNPLTAVMTLAGGSDHYHYCFVSEQAEAGAMTQTEGRVQASCGFWAPNSTSLLSLLHVVFCLHGLIASKHVLDGDLFCYTVSQWIPLRAESFCSDLY